MEETKEKTCTVCHENKLLSCYYRNGKHGLHTICKTCLLKANKAYYENNKARIQERNKDYAFKHKDKIRKYLKEYNTQNAEQIRIRQAKKRDRIYFDGKRDIVLWRDFYKCRKCGSLNNLLVHHIDGNGRGKKANNDTNNLITLCKKCHINEHRGGLYV